MFLGSGKFLCITAEIRFLFIYELKKSMKMCYLNTVSGSKYHESRFYNFVFISAFCARKLLGEVL